MRAFSRALAVAAALGAGSSPPLPPPSEAAEPPSPPPPVEVGPQLQLLKRQIRHFDFEEPATRPVRFPRGFIRGGTGASEPDSPFGTIGYSGAQAHSGEWSVLFELAGGSMSASLNPRQVPIIPGGDYLLTGWIRTEGLAHARARVDVVFLDQTGRTIEASRVTGPLVVADGQWMAVSIEAPCNFPDASDLVFELHLLQPDRFDPRAALPDRPVIEDVAGRAWFDDFAVWHLPRVDVHTGTPGNIIIAPEKLGLTIGINDLASEPINALVTVHDLRGAVVHEASFPVQRGQSADRLLLPPLPFGWYRATVVLANTRETIGATRLDFAYLPPKQSSLENISGLGVNLASEPVAHLTGLVEMVERLDVSALVLPAWDRYHTLAKAEERYERLRTDVDRLLDRGTDIVFALPAVPDELAEIMHLDPHEVMEVFAADEATLKPYLESMLVHFGQRVQRWQIGSTHDASGFWRDDLPEAHDRALSALARLVPGPSVIVPWSAEQSIDAATPLSGYHVTIPSTVRPEAIPFYAESWPSTASDLLVTLEQLPEEPYGPAQRTHDLVMRALYARRAGLRPLLIERPWFWAVDRSQRLMPDSSLPAWVTLARMLEGRQFIGEVPIGRGLRCWHFEGTHGAILVAWNETASDAEATLAAQLAEGPVVAVDMAGNQRSFDPVGEVHSIPLSHEPVFIEGIDPLLARFRQGFAITPAFAPSQQGEHLHEIVIDNPWDILITGTVRILEPAAWQFGPRRMTFSIPAGGEARLPFTLSFSRAELAGPKRLEAEVEVTAERTHHIRISTDFEVGLDFLSVEPVWRVVRNNQGEPVDMQVSAYITNTSARPLTLEAFVLAPGFSRVRRTISQLEPGDTAIKTFHLADGALRLGGKDILIGVSEMDSASRLNKSINIPDVLLKQLAAHDERSPE